MPKLGVNIDHVATLREARKIDMPDPVDAAYLCLKAGCNSIVCHLREDRRHIKDDDVLKLRKIANARLNLEMSVAPDIVEAACRLRPDQSTIVPERREEVTTEGGLDVVKFEKKIRKVVARLEEMHIDVSLFINPVRKQIDASINSGARVIELHTGRYANTNSESARRKQLDVLRATAEYALSKGLEVNAGHGLNYDNVWDVARIDGINELNIGHSIISRSVFTGLYAAVKEMLELIK
ncbi:MAG: pyridoxine 5'-phosphate synthase [Omnitrophica bacterium RIFCSPLOWO2_01_FULL_45_10]|nr:MAG: pyridoxine 5'-phosphate synthase [Omnitrophica bacterium RIFCSPLOWO2_01_FULL_45_10]